MSLDDVKVLLKPGLYLMQVLCMYYRLDSDDVEPLLPGGNTASHEPLWRRNDPDRKKQIRGIYLEDDELDTEVRVE